MSPVKQPNEKIMVNYQSKMVKIVDKASLCWVDKSQKDKSAAIQIQITQDTYHALNRAAAAQGRSVEDLVADAVVGLVHDDVENANP